MPVRSADRQPGPHHEQRSAGQPRNSARRHICRPATTSAAPAWPAARPPSGLRESRARNPAVQIKVSIRPSVSATPPASSSSRKWTAPRASRASGMRIVPKASFNSPLTSDHARRLELGLVLGIGIVAGQKVGLLARRRKWHAPFDRGAQADRHSQTADRQQDPKDAAGARLGETYRGSANRDFATLRGESCQGLLIVRLQCRFEASAGARQADPRGQLADRADECRASAAKHRHAIAQPLDVGQSVRDQNRGAALLLALAAELRPAAAGPTDPCLPTARPGPAAPAR